MHVSTSKQRSSNLQVDWFENLAGQPALAALLSELQLNLPILIDMSGSQDSLEESLLLAWLKAVKSFFKREYCFGNPLD
jgi:hypothetical protein